MLQELQMNVLVMATDGTELALVLGVSGHPVGDGQGKRLQQHLRWCGG